MALAPTVIKTKDSGWHSDGRNNLYLFVSSDKNIRSWKFKGRIKGREIKKTIGYFPTMGLAEARELAATIKSSFKNGINYFEQKQEAEVLANKELVTVANVVTEWLELKQSKGNKQSVIDTHTKRLNKHILPIIGNSPIHDIVKPQLLAICDNSKLTAPHTANKLAEMLQSIFEHATMTEVIASSPAQYLTKLYPKPKSKPNPSLYIEELPELLTALRMGLQFELIDCTTYRMILIQMLTMSRPCEVATLRWEYIDFNAACWTIPVEVMKAKALHTQPLSDYVITLLNEQRPYSMNSEYVFPSARRGSKKPHRNTEIANNALKRLKYQNKLTAHGMRHTAANALAKLNYDRELIDYALAHKVGNVVSRTYNTDTRYIDRQTMLAAWSEYLASISK